jgi:hypothetical protein
LMYRSRASRTISTHYTSVATPAGKSIPCDEPQ